MEGLVPIQVQDEGRSKARGEAGGKSGSEAVGLSTYLGQDEG